MTPLSVVVTVDGKEVQLIKSYDHVHRAVVMMLQGGSGSARGAGTIHHLTPQSGGFVFARRDELSVFGDRNLQRVVGRRCIRTVVR